MYKLATVECIWVGVAKLRRVHVVHPHTPICRSQPFLAFLALPPPPAFFSVGTFHLRRSVQARAVMRESSSFTWLAGWNNATSACGSN